MNKAMSLTLNRLAGTGEDGCFQIARDKSKTIYYCDKDVDLLEEVGEGAVDVIADLMDEVMMEERLVRMMSTYKKLQLEDKIRLGVRPTGRIEKHIYDEVSNRLKENECKCYESNSRSISVIPRCIESQRDAFYVFGKSGSGKSTWASNYAVKYKEYYPNNRIFVFSRKVYDPVLDGKVHGIIRVGLDKSFIRFVDSQQDVLHTFNNSLIIFDDFQQIEDRTIYDAISKLRNVVYEIGRSYGIDVISIQHKGLGGLKTMVELTEADFIVCFPRENLGETIKILQRYCYYDKDTIDKMLDKKGKQSKWMCILRSSRIVITPEYIKIIDN